MKSIGGECRVLSELMVLENHEFEPLTEKLFALIFSQTERRKILVNTPDESTRETL